MLFRQFFDSESSTYTYLIASGAGREALIIDPVKEQVPQYLQAISELDLKLVRAIDTHTHLEVSCRNPFDNYGEEYDRAADKYFRSSRRPTMQETIDFYREKKIGFVNFTVDAETQMGIG